MGSKILTNRYLPEDAPLTGMPWAGAVGAGAGVGATGAGEAGVKNWLGVGAEDGTGTDDGAAADGAAGVPVKAGAFKAGVAPV